MGRRESADGHQRSRYHPNRSEFSYDGTGRRVEIVERNPTSLAILSDKRFVWCGTELCEERDSTGSTVTKRFFPKGEQISGTNYYFTQDHLGSAREMTDTSGTVRAEYDYDPYGQKTKLSGDAVADFGFTGHYNHLNSGLSFALYRGYNPNTGRWLNRDPIQEQGGLNLYDYGSDSPINRTDATGLSDRDLVVIMTAAHNIIDQMTKNGERVNPHYNDVWVWFSKHGQGCRDQALTVTAGLLKNKYDDTWHFSQVRVLHPSLIPIHQFIVAHSTNPNNATVIIDPYENEVMIINPGDQYVGLILNSDTITKGAGNGATTFTSKDF